MREHADKLQESDRKPLEDALKKVREQIAGDDAAAIKSAAKELEQVSHAFSKVMYEKAAAGAGKDAPNGTHGSTSTAGADDAIDAEFEVKKD
jgi:molecular chaperone DnaK